MTLDDVLRLLAADCYSAGGQKHWAAKHGLSRAYVSAVLGRKRPPSLRVLEGLGIEVVVTYQKVRDDNRL